MNYRETLIFCAVLALSTSLLDLALADLLQLLNGWSTSSKSRLPEHDQVRKLIDVTAKFAYEIQAVGSWEKLKSRADVYEKRTKQGSDFDTALIAVLLALKSHPGATVHPPKENLDYEHGQATRDGVVLFGVEIPRSEFNDLGLIQRRVKQRELEELGLLAAIARLDHRDRLLWSLHTADLDAARIEPLIEHPETRDAIDIWLAVLRKLKTQELKGHYRGSYLIRLACDARESTPEAAAVETMLLEVLPLEWEENCHDLAQAARYFPQSSLHLGASPEFPHGSLSGKKKDLAAAIVPLFLLDPLNVDPRVLEDLDAAGTLLLAPTPKKQIWTVSFAEEEQLTKAKVKLREHLELKKVASKKKREDKKNAGDEK